MPSVCAEKAAHCFSIAQPWRSSSQRHGAHHQPSRLAPPKGNQDVHFLLKCLFFKKPYAHHHSQEVTSAAPKRADPWTEVAVLQLGGNTDNHSKCALQQGLYHGKLLKPGWMCKLTSMTNKRLNTGESPLRVKAV